MMGGKKDSSGSFSVGAKASAVYVVSSLLAKGLAVITLPIFTRIMTTDQIGIVNLFTAWQMLIAGFATLSLTSGGFMLAMKEFRAVRDRYMSSILSLTSLIAVCLVLVTLCFRDTVSSLLGLPWSLCMLMAIGFIFMPAYDFWMGKQRYEYKYKSVGAVTMLSSLLSTLAALGAVLLASKAGDADLATVRLIAANVVTFGVAAVLWIVIMVKGKTFFDRNYWKYSLALSLPLVGNTVASQVLSVSDRVMIGMIVGDAAVGIYGTLYSISALILIVWNALNNSFVPFLYENVETEDGAKKVRSVSNGVLLGFGIATFVVSLVAPEVVRLLTTPEYADAVAIVPPILAGVFMTAVSNLYTNMLIFHKQTQYVMISSIIAACANVGMNWIGIALFGYEAAAYTTLFSYIILALGQGIVSESLHIKRYGGASVYNDRVIVWISGGTIAACMACIPLYEHPLLRYCMIGLIIIGMIVLRKQVLQALKRLH